MAWMCANQMFVAVLLLVAGAAALWIVWEAERRRVAIVLQTQVLLEALIVSLMLLLFLHGDICQWWQRVMPW